MLDARIFFRMGFLIFLILSNVGRVYAQPDFPERVENSGDTLFKGISGNGEVLWISRTDNPIVNRTFSMDEEVKVIVEFKSPPLIKAKKEGIALSLAKMNIESEHERLKSDILIIESRLTPQTKTEIGLEFKTVFNGMALKANRTVIGEIETLPYVGKVHPDVEVKALLNESVPLIRANVVWDSLGAKGDSIIIGIIDTGIDYLHPDLTANYIPGGYDFVNDDDDPMDDNGHGTHCAGIAAANGTLKGVAPNAKLMAFKVLGSGGMGYNSWVITGIEKAVDPDGDPGTDDGVDIISMSLGGPGMPDDPMSQAIDNAVEAGVVCAVAAGNSGLQGNFSLGSPGCARKAITVGASDKSDLMASFSSRGPSIIYDIKPDVTAPGVNINSCFLGGGYVQYSGTSMATPHVAGAAALLKQLHPDWSPEMIKDALMEGAKDLGEDCFTQGSGRIDVYKSVTLKGIITPGSVNLGICKVNQDECIKIDTLQIKNISNEQQSYSLSFEHALPVGVNLSISPDDVSLDSGQTQDIIFTLSVDNTIITDPPDMSHPYTGKIIAQSTTDTLRVLFSFVRSLSYQEGWPFVDLIRNFNIDQSITAGNLDVSDEQEELVLCMYHKVYAFNHDATPVNGWPIRPDNTWNFRGASIAVQDEIGRVAFATCEYTPTKTYVPLQDGSMATGWPITTQPVFRCPVWADIDGDDSLEVIAGGDLSNTEIYIGIVYAWNLDGSAVPGWPVSVRAPVTGIAVGDVNDNGEIEVVISNITLWHKYMCVISSTGDILNEWEPNAEGLASENNPVLVDLNGDNDLEILQSGYNDLLAYHHNGEEFWSRKILEGGSDVSPIAIGDLDGDDSLEVVACNTTRIYVWNQNGNLKQGWPISIPKVYWTYSSVEKSGPIIGDIDGDNDQEIVVNGLNNDRWWIYAFNPNGTVVDGFPYIEMPGFEPASTPVIADLDRDGNIEICSYGQSHENPYFNHLRVGVYDLGAPYDTFLVDWPMLQHDPQRTGCFKKTGGTGVVDEPGNGETPSEFALSQNYPNPFNLSTKIEFTLSHSGFVSLHIYDLMGRKIRTLVSENLSSGYKSVFWDGKDNYGKNVASGIYFYQLKVENPTSGGVGDFSEGKKLVLLK